MVRYMLAPMSAPLMPMPHSHLSMTASHPALVFCLVSPGFLGVKSLNHYSGPLKNGLMPTPFQSFALGSGHSVSVAVYSVEIAALATGGKTGDCQLNGRKESAWLDGHECIWKQHGVWSDDSGAPQLLKPEYFKDAKYGEEHYLPFSQRYMEVNIGIQLEHDAIPAQSRR